MDTHIRSRWLMSVSSLLGSSDGRLENREHSLGEGGYSPSNPLWRDIFEVKSYFEADTENHTQISSLINCCVVMVKDIIASGLMQWSSRYMRKFICRSNKTDIWHLTLSSYFQKQFSYQVLFNPDVSVIHVHFLRQRLHGNVVTCSGCLLINFFSCWSVQTILVASSS